MTRKRLSAGSLLGWSGLLARLLVAAVTIGVLATAHPAESWAWPVLALGLGCFLTGTFLMHRHERWALGLLSYAALSAAVLTGMPGANSLVLVLVSITDVAVMTFARTPRLRHNQPTIALGLTCAIAYGVSAALFDRTGSWFLSQLLWTAVLVLFGLNRRYDEIRNQQTAKLLEQTRRAQQEHTRAAALDERTRIARELHDVLAHSLGALSVQLELAEALLFEADDRDAALDRIRRSRRLAVQGLTEARNAVATLRQDEVPPLPTALSGLIGEHERDHGGTARFALTGEARTLGSGVVVALLGAARESLTNAARHAPGNAVEVDLAYLSGGVRLTVRNPVFSVIVAAGPPGSDTTGSSSAASGGGYGIAGMRERLALVGGRLSAGIVAGQWVVVAEVDDE